MNILYDHQIFAMQRYGGISRYFYEIVSRVAQKENVFLYEGWHINEYGLEKVKNVNVINACKRPMIPKTGRIFNWLNKWGSAKYIGSSKYDIYHPTYYRDFSSGKSRLVITVHDMIHELFPGYFTNADYDIAQKKKIILKADRIIAISESTKQDLMNIYDISEDKIDIVYHGNSLVLPVMEERVVKEPYILFVGMRSNYKNFERMLRAFADCEYSRDLKCIAFGGGVFADEELSLINELKLSGNVLQMTGDDNILANLYKYAEVFVYPSEYEGFGLPLLEAMHYGTPVLCSNTSSLPEVAGEAVVYFNPLEIEDMRNMFDKVLGDESLREDLKKRGLVREKMFSWERCADETISVYNRVLN